MKHAILPRIVRIGEAPAYLGMNRALFDTAVRPYLTIVRIGTKGLAVERNELDAWADRIFEQQRVLDNIASGGSSGSHVEWARVLESILGVKGKPKSGKQAASAPAQ